MSGVSVSHQQPLSISLTCYQRAIKVNGRFVKCLIRELSLCVCHSLRPSHLLHCTSVVNSSFLCVCVCVCVCLCALCVTEIDQGNMSERFDCDNCKESLYGRKYIQSEDNPYCIPCYDSLFANTCDECKELIGHDARVSFQQQKEHYCSEFPRKEVDP